MGKAKKIVEDTYITREDRYNSRRGASVSGSANFYEFYGMSAYPHNFKDSGCETIGDYNLKMIDLLNNTTNEEDKNNIKAALILNNLGMIYKKVNEGTKSWGDFKRGAIDYDDLIQEAIINFLDKITTFDATKGYALNTYALSYMPYFIKDYIEENEFGVEIKAKTYRKIKRIVSEYKEEK